MNRQSPFAFPLLFVALALIGLVGMLMAEGPLDTLFLAAATAPLAIGWIYRARARRKQGKL
ncbi:MAG: hypothetical protein ABWY12_09090 [Burkholderiales bacterium]